MIAAQRIEEEAEMMEMLLLEELEWTGRGLHELLRLDAEVERALDNFVYEKYQKLVEKQALEMTQVSIEGAYRRHI